MRINLEKVLITGSGGMVGSYIDFGMKTDRRSLDVANLKEVIDVCKKYHPAAILHLAAETDVDKCERESEYAYLANSVGTYNMAAAAKEIGAKMVYISTAGVFDGTKNGPYAEDDEPNPQNYYGRSKYLGELAVRGILKNYIIVRACWTMGGGPAKDKKFVGKIINQIQPPSITEVRAPTDEIGSPTFAKDLISAIKILIKEDKSGIFHLSNVGVASRYDTAKFIIDTLKPQIKVIPVESSYFNPDVNRARNQGLISKINLNLMRPWQEALKEYLEIEWKPFLKL